MARPIRLAVVIVVLLGLVSAGYYGFSRHQSQQDCRERVLKAYHAGKAEGTSDDLERCLQLWPNDSNILRAAARLTRISGKLTEAEAYLNRALEIDGGATSDTQLEFLLLRLQRGEVDEVSGSLIKLAEEGHPDSELIFESVARAFMASLRYSPGYAILERWVSRNPDAAMPLLLQGYILERMNSLPRAIELYRAAIKLDPEQSTARLHLAEIYLSDTRPADARPHLEWLLSHNPELKLVPSRLGLCLFLEGNLDEARTMLEKSAELTTDDPTTYLTLGRIEMQAGHPEQGEKWIRKAIEIDPKNPDGFYLLSLALTAQSRDEDAAAAMDTYKRMNAQLKILNARLKEEAFHESSDPDRYEEIGNALLETGEENKGLFWLNRALEVNQNHIPTRKRLVAYYQSRGEPQKALIHQRIIDQSKR